MVYVKTTWKDRIVQFANRFTKSNETPTSVTLTADPGIVTEAGTPLSATNLNKIEQGIADATAAAENAVTAQVVGGTDTAITLTMAGIAAYSDNLLLTFIAGAANSGAATTININGLGTKSLYKPNTTTAPNLVAGKAYTVWYDAGAGCFFWQASAEGTAVAADVLAGKPFSNEDDTGIIGTMPNNPSPAAILTTQGASKVVPAGYSPGGTITANITNLSAGNVKDGAVVGGVTGNFSEYANGATAAQILTGRSAAVNGATVNGSMPSNASPATTLTTQGASKVVPLGYNPGGTISVNISNLSAGNVKNGANVGGVIGNYTGISSLAAGEDRVAFVATLQQLYNQLSYAYLRGGYICSYGGTVRVKFKLGCSVSGTGYAKIYKNGVAVGTERSVVNKTSNFTQFTEDIAVSAGDDIQIYAKTSSGAEVYVTDMEICIDLPMTTVTTGS